MPPNILKKIRDDKFTETDGNLLWLRLNGNNANSDIDISGYSITAQNLTARGNITTSGGANKIGTIILGNGTISEAEADISFLNTALHGISLVNGLGISTSASQVDFALPTSGHFIFDDSHPAGWLITDLAMGGVQLGVTGNSALNQNLLTTSDVTHNNLTLSGEGITIGAKVLHEAGDYLKSDSAFRIGTGISLFTSGKFYASQLSCGSSANYATMLVQTSGMYAYRNIGDSNSAFKIRQMHADSTGDILELHNNAGVVVRVLQNGNIVVDGAISSATATITASSDTTDVSGINTLFINTTSGDVTLGGLVGGVDGQKLDIIKIVAVNDLILEHEEGIGGDTDDFFMHQLGDETIDSGGVVVVFNGTTSKWYDTSHAKHV